MTAYHRSPEAKERMCAGAQARWSRERNHEATERRERIAMHAEAGRTQVAIAAEIGVTQQRIQQLLKAHRMIEAQPTTQPIGIAPGSLVRLTGIQGGRAMRVVNIEGASAYCAWVHADIWHADWFCLRSLRLAASA